jgi:RimJ/RimL family protein N-acetyltransferase
MSVAAVALAAAGTTCLELALFGVPMVLVSVADNQVIGATALAEKGAATYLGELPGVAPAAAANALVDLWRDEGRRAAMGAAGRTLVDGGGAPRVVSRMLGSLLQMRDVRTDDSRLVYEWNNHPSTRAASFSTAPIGWEEHERWMSQRLAGTGAPLMIGTDPAGHDIGLVRFDREGSRARIGVVVAPERRGEGWSSALIDAGCTRLRALQPVSEVVAEIRPENLASRKAFEAADFDLDVVGAQDRVQYTRRFDGNGGR